jgi:hypothetical protein
VTIAARLYKRSVRAASALILASISSTSTASAEPERAASPPPTTALASDLTAIDPAGVNAPRSARRSASAEPALIATSADLDGLHLWLGAWGARTEASEGADSCVGLELAMTRIRERAWLGTLGVAVNAGRYASSDDGRISALALAGTRRGTGWMIGASAGPLLELSPTARPKRGASVGIWAFAGVVPFVRVAAVEGRGAFFEAGVSIALPIVRWRR